MIPDPLSLLLVLASAPLLQEPAAYALHLARGTDGPVLEAVPLAAGEEVVFPPEDTIAVVLPPSGPGTSGALAHAGEGEALVARERGGVLSVRTADAEGRGRALAAAPVAELAALEVRVSVVGADGTGRSWRVRGWREVVPDEIGPALDLFRGLLPLGPDDWVVTTEARRPWTDSPVRGRVELVLGGAHFFAACAAADGSPGWVLVDTAAGTTVVTPALVPVGVPVEPATMTEHSPEGSRVLDARPIGATGTVEGPVGMAVLPRLDLGAGASAPLRFEDCPVRVLDALPEVDGRRVLGILGLDLLERGGTLVLVPPREDRPGSLELGATLARATANARELACARAGGLVFVRAALDGRSVPLALDSGARASLLERRTAGRLGLELDPGSILTLHGLGGAAEDAPLVLAPPLDLGPGGTHDVELHACSLPALASLAPGDSGGVLGAPFLASFERVELDLAAGRLRLVGEAP